MMALGVELIVQLCAREAAQWNDSALSVPAVFVGLES
jgi:hypothetical protein